MLGCKSAIKQMTLVKLETVHEFMVMNNTDVILQNNRRYKMPKSKLENFIFTVMMAFIMVYAMICYNIALNIGGMTNQVFVMAFHELVIMWPVAIILELVIAERAAKFLTFKAVDPRDTKPLMIQVILCSMIVCVMCPLMSLIATVLFKNPGSEIIAVWLQTAVFNFPMALGWQIFFGGPLIRFIFKKMFRRD